jgi:glycosyltransferase involved in cell wall biosynthesis
VSSLRIGLVAPPYYAVPPDGYGGTERVCHLLADGLVERGHQVTLVAAGGSRTKADLVVSFDTPQPEGTREDAFIEVVHAAHAAAVFESIGVDLVHDHTRAGPLTAGSRSSPTLVTVHSPVNRPDSSVAAWLALGRWVRYVAISEAQRRGAPFLPWAGTVHNGVRISDFPYRPDKEPYVLYLGRISADKGVHLAIDAAERARRPLLIAGSYTIPEEHEYFETRIRPRVGGSVSWLGEVRGENRLDLLSRASCAIAPATWEEPFGLVLIEAMACGTPVAGLRRGSLPEVVVDGVTGVLCDDPDDLAQAVAGASGLSPNECRRHARTNFSA